MGQERLRTTDIRVVINLALNLFPSNEYHGVPDLCMKCFLQKEFLEPTSPNVTLFVAEANDGDGGKFGEVTYSLSRSNWETFGGNTCLPPHEVFSIKPDTGEVYATRT